jgi:hypothetical protein
MKQKQLSCGLTSSMRASAFFTTSTGESLRAAMRRARTVAGV